MVILRTDSARQTSRAKKLRKLGSETPAFEPVMNKQIFLLQHLSFVILVATSMLPNIVSAVSSKIYTPQDLSAVSNEIYTLPRFICG